MIKAQMLADPGLLVKLVSRDATRCYYCKEPGHISCNSVTDAKKMNIG